MMPMDPAKATRMVPGFLGLQVIKAQLQSGGKIHGRFAQVPVHRFSRFLFAHGKRPGVRNDIPVLQLYNPVGVLPGQLRVMGHHDYQVILRHLFEDIHNLNAGHAVQRPRRFIRQKNIRIVHQRPGDGHPLHLSPGKLAGLLMKLVSQTHFGQGLRCFLSPFFLPDSGNGQCQFHVGQDGLMGNQIVTLEHEPDGVVPVGIPIPVRVLLGGCPVDDQVPAVVPVQSAKYVQQRGFAGTGGSQNRHELAVPEIQAHAVQRFLHQSPGAVLFSNVFNLQHLSPFPL